MQHRLPARTAHEESKGIGAIQLDLRQRLEP